MVNVVEELEKYLSHEDPRIQKNAVTALAATCASEVQAVEKLVAIALNGEHAASCRACTELLDRRFPAASHARDVIFQALEEPTSSGPANKLLVDMKVDSTPAEALSVGQRWQIGQNVQAFISPVLNVRFIWRAIKASWLGGISSTLLVALGLAFLDPPVEEAVFYGTFLVSFILSPVFGVLSAQSMNDVSSYVDRKIGVVVELLAPIRDLWLWLATLFVLLGNAIFFWLPKSTASLSSLAVGTLLATIFAMLAFVAVRIGSLLAGNVVPYPVLDRCIRAMSGTASGWFLLTVLFLPSFFWRLFWHSDLVGLRAESWFLFIPLAAAYGVAATASLRPGGERTVLGSFRRILVRATTALLVVFGLTTWIVIAAAPLPKATEGEEHVEYRTFDGPPAKLGFRVAFSQSVEAWVEPPSDSRVLRLWQGQEELRHGNIIRLELKPGLYRLEVTQPASEGLFLGSSYFEAARGLAYRFVSLAQMDASSLKNEESFNLGLRLNATLQPAENPSP